MQVIFLSLGSTLHGHIQKKRGYVGEPRHTRQK